MQCFLIQTGHELCHWYFLLYFSSSHLTPFSSLHGQIRDRTKAQVLKMKHGTETQEALPLGDLFKQTQQDPKTSKQSTTHSSLLWLNIDTKIHGLTLPTQAFRKELGCLRWACWWHH